LGKSWNNLLRDHFIDIPISNMFFSEMRDLYEGIIIYNLNQNMKNKIVEVSKILKLLFVIAISFNSLNAQIKERDADKVTYTEIEVKDTSKNKI